MFDSRFTKPALTEIVRRDDIEDMLHATEASLVELDGRAASLRVELTDLERRVVLERADVDTADWMLVRFHRFLVDWRDEVETECILVVEGARLEARRVVRRAAANPLDLSGALAARRAPRHVPTPPRAPVIRWEPVAVAPPPVATPEPVLVAAPEPPSMGLDDPLTVLPDFDPAPDVDHEDVDLDLVTAERDFWTDDPAAQRRPRLLRRRPSAAVTLQAAAGLTLVAAAVVHFA
jgi:hypothetical protein